MAACQSDRSSTRAQRQAEPVRANSYPLQRAKAPMALGASDRRGFMEKHSGAVALLAVGVVIAAAWAVYVFWWFTRHAQSTGLVPSTLDLWTTGNLVLFIIYAILWELLLVGVPAAVVGVIAWRWWRRRPLEDREPWPWGKGSRRAGGSGGASFLLFLAFCLKVYLDGNWNVPIASFSVDYVVGSVITILAWAAVIFGIPLAIGLVWWVRHETRKP